MEDPASSTDDRDTLEPPAPTSRKDPSVPGLTIIFHPDVSRIGERAMLHELRAGKPVGLSRNQPAFSSPCQGKRRCLEDPCISRQPVTLHARPGGLVVEPHGGAIKVDGVGLERGRSIDHDELRDGVTVELAERVVLLLHMVDETPPAQDSLGLVGHNRAIEELRRDILRVADLSVPVLVRGETGTGKELVARAVHDSSARKNKPFVSVNIAAIPAATAASELFGHSRGAFTGATSEHPGYFAQAEGGTLFLDEIGATPQEVQPMLLRALESLEIQPLGSGTTRRVDVRIIAATDADLEQKIDEGSFRAAVYHRLEGYQLFVPPLRQRRDDVGRLLAHFVGDELNRIGQADRWTRPPDGDSPWLDPAFVARLTRLCWPGNVRQLRNVVRQFSISSRDLDQVRVDAALERLLAGATAAQRDAPMAPDVPDMPGAPSVLSDDDLLASLRRHEFHVPAAARELGISRSALYARVQASDKIPQAKNLTAEDIASVREGCGNDVTAMARALDVSARALAQRLRALGLAES